MKPHSFVQARRPRAATEVLKCKSVRPSVVSVEENTSAHPAIRNRDLTAEADFATNFIASYTYSMSASGRFGIKPQAINDAKWKAAA